jgi:hypothetical protein
MVFAKLLQENYLKNLFLGRSHMGTLGTKTSQWRPGHVHYLPYPRYATSWSLSNIVLEYMSNIHDVVLKLLYGIETERTDGRTDKLISKGHFVDAAIFILTTKTMQSLHHVYSYLQDKISHVQENAYSIVYYGTLYQNVKFSNICQNTKRKYLFVNVAPHV